MNVNTLGILNLMSHIINEEHDTSDYVITKYLLTNLKVLDDITINDIVDSAHVSRSSVRRYAMRLGYDNFSDFKGSFSGLAFPSNVHLRDYYGFVEYKNLLNNQLSVMRNEMDSLVTLDVVSKFSDELKSHENVFIVCANNTASNMDKFQQELMYAHKLVKVISSNFHEDFTKNTEMEDNLILVVSISGLFSTSISDEIAKLSGRKILLTGNHNDSFKEEYDDVYYLSSRNVNADQPLNEDKLGLIGKYGVTYFFDLVSQYYIFTTHHK